MPATYPYVAKDRLLATDLNLDLELNPGAVPPSSPLSGARIYKQWIDTSVTPPVLRMCVGNPASATYNAADWMALASIDTTNKKFNLVSVVVADTPPASPLPGTLWWDSGSTGNLYVSYFDGNSQQWVAASQAGAGTYLPLAGGTIKPGPLVINANAASPLAPVMGSGIQVSGVDGAGNTALEIDAYGTGFPAVNLASAGGTSAAKTATPNNQVLGDVAYFGWNGTAFSRGAQIFAQTSQAWSGTQQGTTLQFMACPQGSSALGLAGQLSVAGGGQWSGTQTNDNALAGWVGEYLTTTGGPLSMTNNTFATLCSLSIPAGDWDLWGWFSITNPSGMQMGEGGFATAVNGTPTGPLSLQSLIGGSSFTNFFMPVTQMRVSQASAQSWYLNCACTFGAGTSTCSANMYARRRR